MVMQKAKSGLIAKLGNRIKKGHEQHASAETTYSKFGELPPGINAGIAQLVDAKFDVYKEGDNQGKYYFYAAGIVVSPVEFKDRDGVVHRIGGLRTSITEPLCDTPQSKGERLTVEDHLGWIYNQLRRLGVDTEEMDPEDLEGTVAALVEAGPYFKFRTWQGKATEQFPDPRVNHEWNGWVDFVPPEANGDGTEDNTPTGATVKEPEAEEAPTPIRKVTAAAAVAVRPTPAAKPSSNGAKPAAKPTASRTPAPASAPAKAPAKATPAKGKPAPAPAPVAEEFDEYGDLDSLVASATAGKDNAQQQLSDLAEKAGMSTEDIDNAPDWQSLADFISGQGGDTEGTQGDDEATTGEPEDDGAEYTPAKEDVVMYRPIDPKSSKPVKKAIECEVTAVNPGKQTVTLKNLDNTKVSYQNIGWDKLESVS